MLASVGPVSTVLALNLEDSNPTTSLEDRLWAAKNLALDDLGANRASDLVCPNLQIENEQG